MKSRACAINHDHVLRAFHANGVRYSGRNYHADIVAPAKIISIDRKTHDASGEPGADIAQDHFDSSLQKKHHIPLLAIVRSQRIILRIGHEQPALPFLGSRIGRNARWMNVKSLCAVREHARSRPLPWPKPDFGERAFVLAHKFAEASSMRLRKDLSHKNLDTWDPNAFDVGFAPVSIGQFGGLDSGAADALGKGAGLIIPRNERISRVFIQAGP